MEEEKNKKSSLWRGSRSRNYQLPEDQLPRVLPSDRKFPSDFPLRRKDYSEKYKNLQEKRIETDYFGCLLVVWLVIMILIQIWLVFETVKLKGISVQILNEFNIHTGVDLSGADLKKADLSRTNLEGVKLTGVNLIGADLSLANLRRANLIEANLSLANLRRANLSLANLIRADLRKADLREVNLTGADLRGTNLGGANLMGANLREVRYDKETIFPEDLKTRGHLD